MRLDLFLVYIISTLYYTAHQLPKKKIKGGLAPLYPHASSQFSYTHVRSPRCPEPKHHTMPSPLYPISNTKSAKHSHFLNPTQLP